MSQKKPHAGLWKKGQSGNPKGRPRRGNALAEAIRRYCDPQELVAVVYKMATESLSETTKLAACEWLAKNGYEKPAHRIEIGAAGAYEALEVDELESSLHETRAMIASLQKALAAHGEQPLALPPAVTEAEIVEEPERVTFEDLEAAEVASKKGGRD